jgi:hypothetical protein
VNTTQELAQVIADRKDGFVLDGGVYLRSFVNSSNDVINIEGRHRELVRADVDAVREALAEIGYEEVKSWIAMQHVSWLSGGVEAGVSFEIKETAK